ncbi:MAG: glycosyltransferase, partial [Solirubrobacterales bacterium]|nr:glycosyltransferase [Solirubrobacterales bacterium]
MRLLLVSDSYPPLIGGATRATQILARDLSARGHDVCVATSWQAGAPERETDDHGVRVRRLHGIVTRLHWLSADSFRRIPPPFPDPETTIRFARLIRRVRPDVIHCYGWMTYSCLLALFIARSRIPLIVSARDYGNVCALRTLLRQDEVCDGPAPVKCLTCARHEYGLPKAALAVGGVLGARRPLARRATLVHSVSRYVDSVMRRDLSSGRQSPAFAVVPDYRPGGETAEPDAAVLARLPSEPYILFVGALRRVKGVEELIAAYELLDGDRPPLVLIGTRAPDSPTEFPDGVHVFRDVPYSTVLAAWDGALFGVAPSTLPEPLGNVVHEAMSRGRPVIGTTPGGHADMITDGVTGRLVPPRDVTALAAAMRELVASPSTTERMG